MATSTPAGGEPSPPADPLEAAAVRIDRSPADMLRLVTGVAVLVVLLVVEWLAGDALIAFGSDLLQGLAAIPDWIVDVVVLGTWILGFTVLGGGLVWALSRRQWRLLGTVGLAGAVAYAIGALADVVVGRSRDPAAVQVRTLSDSDVPTLVAIAVVTAILTAAAPWMNRRRRRAGWALVLGMVTTRFLATPVSFASPIAYVVGWVAGAGVLVALGAPSRRPTMGAVIDGLASVGLPIRELNVAGVDARGSKPYFGVAADGSKVFVKALGDDERSADLLFRLYRYARRRNFGDERPFSSLRRTVEHEAMVALAARDVGVRTPRLRSFATAAPNGFVLAYEAIAGKSLDRVDPADVTDDVLAALWKLVGTLRERRIAHRDLRLANIFLDDRGKVWLIDFGFSELAASDLLLATDVAELLASSCLSVGPRRAVASSLAVLDVAALSSALDRLHLWALSGATRAGHKARPELMGELRAAVTDAISADVMAR